MWLDHNLISFDGLFPSSSTTAPPEPGQFQYLLALWSVCRFNTESFRISVYSFFYFLNRFFSNYLWFRVVWCQYEESILNIFVLWPENQFWFHSGKWLFFSLLFKSSVKGSIISETRLLVKALLNTANLIIQNNLHSLRTSIQC